MEDLQPTPLPETISDYVKTHCVICAAGWTRTGLDGSRVYFCLLDRQAVWPQMAHCDRFEVKEATHFEPMPEN